ncbi:MAG: PD-(D/E)XK nuclease family transposase, partial [Prevotella sp.]|nr:PD-(D/E)XK nuclease family transposase [Prevotella sp.]
MKGKYLNPKADVTFKRIFGEHPQLVKSLLNALLPLDEGKQIESVEYAPAELVPENPGKKNSVVDVRCKETGGRHFIVEMQMNWNNEFQRRVVLNASKAVVK